MGDAGVICYDPIGFLDDKEANVIIYVDGNICHPTLVCEQLALVDNIECYMCGTTPDKVVYERILKTARLLLGCQE